MKESIWVANILIHRVYKNKRCILVGFIWYVKRSIFVAVCRDIFNLPEYFFWHTLLAPRLLINYTDTTIFI